MGAAASYPDVPGESYDSLNKQGRITFSEDADTIEVVDRFKKKTGVDLFSLKGSEFGSTIMALGLGRQIAGKYKAPPTKYSFYHTLRKHDRSISEPASNYAHDYFFKDPETLEEKAKKIESGEKTDAQKAADAAKDAKAGQNADATKDANAGQNAGAGKKDKTWAEWLFGSTDDTTDGSTPSNVAPSSSLTSMLPSTTTGTSIPTGAPSTSSATNMLSGLSLNSASNMGSMLQNQTATGAPAGPAPVP